MLCNHLFYSALFCYVLFSSALFCSNLLCFVLFCSDLLCFVPFSFVLFCSDLFCTVDSQPNSTVTYLMRISQKHICLKIRITFPLWLTSTLIYFPPLYHKCKYLLRGHSGAITSIVTPFCLPFVSTGCTDTLLASCGLDRRVILWTVPTSDRKPVSLSLKIGRASCRERVSSPV